MAESPTYEELEQRVSLLNSESVQRKRFEAITLAFCKIASAVNTTFDLDELFKTVRLFLNPILDTTNFCIAFYDKAQGNITFPYIKDSLNEADPPIVGINESTALIAEVIRANAPTLLSKAEILRHCPENRCSAPAYTPAEVWLGVPLKSRDEIIGVMAVQNYYDPQSYDGIDLNVMVAVADLLAIAIERKQADEALQGIDDRFKRLLQDIPSIAVQGYQPDGTNHYWNHASELLYGYSAQEAIGRNLLDLIIPPEIQNNVRKAIQQMAETGQPIPASELSLMRKDGARVPVYSSHAIVMEPGQCQTLFCIDIDLTALKRSEVAFQTSSAHLGSIFRAAPVGIGVVTDRVFKQVNERLCQMIGYSQTEIIDQCAEILYIDKPSYDYVGSEKYRQIQLHGTGVVETKWRQKDGNIIDVLLSSSPLDISDLSKGVTFTAMDITERKRAEGVLSRFQLLVTHSRDIILFIRCSDGRILEANKSAVKAYGYSHEELLEMSIHQLREPSSMKMVPGQMQQADDHGVLFETVHLCKDGTPFPVEVSAQAETIDGVRTLISVVRDITERKKGEEALRESEERYRQLFNINKDSMFVHLGPTRGRPGRFIEVNDVACQRLGYSRNELLQMSPPDIDAPDTLAGLPNIMEQLSRKGHAMWEGAHLTKDGRRIPVEIINRLFDFRGTPMVLSSVRDITERKQAEDEREKLQSQLNQAQKMESVGRLAGGVAHDFNNKLGVIIGYTEMILDQVGSNHPLFPSLEEIAKAAESSADLTRQLLAFARKQTIAPKLLDLNETVSEMLNMLRRLIGEEIDLAWFPGKDLWAIKVDPSQIDQILANLCVNAKDAITGVGKIIIETGTTSFDEAYCKLHVGSVPGDYVYLSLSDNGCGMDKKTISHLYEPFFTTKEQGKGTGLGLATVYGVVKQNRGFINVYSQPGRGSTFKIYLPRHKGLAKQNITQKQVELASQGHETILLVEDESSILQMTTIMLEQLGYTVLAAITPGQAIELAERNTSQINLLITDVVMPEMNGKELSKKIIALHPNLKHLFVSGYTTNVIAHQGVLEEGVHFIQKPFHRNDLADKIREVLMKPMVD